MRVPGLLIMLFVLLALQAVFLREAFSANSYIQTTGGSPSEAFFGASQGGTQVQLMASRPVYYVAAVPTMRNN
jgi:hypothetical protein